VKYLDGVKVLPYCYLTLSRNTGAEKMNTPKVTIDPANINVQILGKYRFDTQGGGGNLSSVSRRKHYPDMLSMDRPERCIKEAIKNYKNELAARLAAYKGH